MWTCGWHYCHNGSLIYFVKNLTSHSIKSEFLWAREVSDIWLLCFRTPINTLNTWELQIFLCKTGKKILSNVSSKKDLNSEGSHWYSDEVWAFNSPGGAGPPSAHWTLVTNPQCLLGTLNFGRTPTQDPENSIKRRFRISDAGNCFTLSLSILFS